MLEALSALRCCSDEAGYDSKRQRGANHQPAMDDLRRGIGRRPEKPVFASACRANPLRIGGYALRRCSLSERQPVLFTAELDCILQLEDLDPADRARIGKRSDVGRIDVGGIGARRSGAA